MNRFTKLINFLLLFFALVGFNMHGQIEEVVVVASDDAIIGDGLISETNLGYYGSNAVTNWEDIEGWDSYHETWMKFDLSSVTIPDGNVILYAELVLMVAWNDASNPQGVHIYHLKDIDDWVEGQGTYADGIFKDDLSGKGITWSAALEYDFENTTNNPLIISDNTIGGTSSHPEIAVTDAVKYELGSEGNNTLSLRMTPYHNPEFDGGNKMWLGFYSRESVWGDDEDPTTIHEEAPYLRLIIGPKQETVFSDMGDFSDIEKYEIFPPKFGYWMVGEDDGDLKLLIGERPGPINKTPGAVAVIDGNSYSDFDFSLQAKVPEILNSDKADFAIVFGYSDPKNYQYLYLTGNEECGFFNVVDGEKVEIGERITNAALVDDAYHTYKLTRKGSTISAYIDDVQYCTITNDDLKTEGKIGVGTYNDIVYFDDIIEGVSETNFEVLNTTISEAQAKIDNAEIGDQDGQYKQEVVDALNDAISTAKQIAGNEDSDQASVNSADETLKAAVQIFIESVNGVFKGNLSDAITAAQAKIDASEEGEDIEGKYDVGAIEAFQLEIDAVKSVNDNTEATQEEVNNAIDNLKAAEENFDKEFNTVGIDSITAKYLNIYPNPVVSEMYISNAKSIKTVNVTNLIGQNLCLDQTIESGNLKINTSSLISGVYMVTIKLIDGQYAVKKIFVQ